MSIKKNIPMNDNDIEPNIPNKVEKVMRGIRTFNFIIMLVHIILLFLEYIKIGYVSIKLSYATTYSCTK